VRLIKLPQRGDTIVEVLFAITILSVVLSSTYTVANKAVTTNRLNYERTQAVKYAEGQIELIKVYSSSKTKAEFQVWRTDMGTTGTKCIDASDLVGLSLTTGTACAREGKYTLTVSYSNSTEETSYFTSRVVWDTTDPDGGKNVELLYRVYNEK